MSNMAFLIGAVVVALSAKPSYLKAQRTIREARQAILELKRRKHALSQKVRMLAKESLDQRLTAGQDQMESDDLTGRIAGLQHRVQELEAIDRRVLVLDERRGLSESGWIIRLRRPPDQAPALEPSAVTRLWEEGRYVFFFASDVARARRKSLVRFPEEQGFEILEVIPHADDLSTVSVLGQVAQKESA
ncbi:LapA family protein [Aerophototrophica crusticola]|uniref:LapA family protein n=1 Tax=Aerophototrophica crusticola TaxID=1709002 RepID=A0A858R8Z4_9PROT|nr:LapA family protein [Rhodospirillaceae bacterium B3]